MTVQRNNLWAPWRIKYIQGLSQKSPCFLCDYLAGPEKDAENFVLWRTEKAFVVFNRFPYNNGHLLIAPTRHIADLQQADEQELLIMTKLVRECQKALSLTIKPHGFNVGMNFGRCAGAGLPGHLHVHIVPRWNGDTNFMPVLAGAKVIVQSLEALYQVLLAARTT
jgi:ATP adenylyltransferase